MKKIRVHTAFDFTKPDYSQVHFAVGDHSVEASVAEHWFTLQHAEILGGGKEEQAEVDALFQAEIANLQDQLTAEQDKVAMLTKVVAERNQAIAEHVQTITDSDSTIANLQDQLKSVQAQLAAQTEGTKGGKK